MDVFNTPVSRKGTYCTQWDFCEDRFGVKDVLPFSISDMDLPIPDAITRALKKRLEHPILGYSRWQHGEYLNAIVNWYYQQYQTDIKPEWITYSPSVMYSIAKAIELLTSHGDNILVFTPVYNAFFDVIKHSERNILTASLIIKNEGGYAINWQDFDLKIKSAKMMLLCNPHNPTGTVWSEEELHKIAASCTRHNVWLCSDEIHSDFIYPGHQHHVFASLKTELQNITITCTAPTKTFNLAGLQISNIFIADEKLRLQFKKAIASTGYSQCNLFGLVACQTAYESCSSWLEDLKQYLFENTRFVDEYLKEYIPLIKLIIPEGTYLLWLDFRRLQISDKELNDLLIEHARLWLDSGTMFGKEGKGFQRINIACPRAYLRQALNQLKNALEEIEY